MSHGRKVRLVVHRIEPVSVLKYSLVLFLSLYVVLVVAGVVMWIVASSTGLRDNVEGFIGSLLASDDFQFLGKDILRASVTGGAVLVALGTGANLVMVTLYNLISNLVGGVQVTFEQPGTDDEDEADLDGHADAAVGSRAGREAALKVDRPTADKVTGPTAPQPVAVPEAAPVD